MLLSFSLSPLQAQVNADQDLFSSNNADVWLAKMANATTSLNYQISFVLLKPGKDAQPFLWRHGITEDGTVMEQLNLLNGPGREVLRIGEQVSYFEPNVPPYTLQSTLINGPLPMGFLTDPQSLATGYEFITVGRSRISGRAAQQIRVVSKDRSRFSFNVWLDQETGLMLKLNMVDLNGQLVEQVQVTELQVSDTIHPYFDRIEVNKLPPVIALAQNQPIDEKWRIRFLPVGMKMVKQDIHRLPVTGKVVEYMMLSDGLVDVSVYLQPAPAQSSTDDLLLRHESDTFLTRRQGQLLVTVVGKVPPQTANAIAESVQLLN